RGTVAAHGGDERSRAPLRHRPLGGADSGAVRGDRRRQERGGSLMHRLASVLFAIVIAASGCSRAASSTPGADAGGAVALSIACGALGVELRLCTEAVDAWEARTGHRVSIVSTPNSSSDRLALYLQMLGSRTADVDVLQIDVVWTGLLAPHLADLTGLVGD